MTLLALLLSSDDSASQVLGETLPACGMAVERFSDPTSAIDRLRQQKCDTLILDYENAAMASEVYVEACKLHLEREPMTVALVSNPGQTREVLDSGAQFILYKPLSEKTTRAGLRALLALLTRERRRAYRVPVQAPVDVLLPDTRQAEGILLDLSETGMDVLTAEVQVPGALLNFRFQLPDGSLKIDAHGQVAWAKENGQAGVKFLDLDASVKRDLQAWVQASAANGAGAEEIVPHCKLTDLSLGGCYVETESPFPERALIDLRLRAGEMAVHTEGMVRVMHPGCGMGVEFPSRTEEQRAQVENLIGFLQSCADAPQMEVSPRELKADLNEFSGKADGDEENMNMHMEDPLLELIRHGTALQREEFLEELLRQRSGEGVAQ